MGINEFESEFWVADGNKKQQSGLEVNLYGMRERTSPTSGVQWFLWLEKFPYKVTAVRHFEDLYNFRISSRWISSFPPFMLKFLRAKFIGVSRILQTAK